MMEHGALYTAEIADRIFTGARGAGSTLVER
jgi:hypothetical protein